MRRPIDREQRASFVELFFDLVFVFAVTQLSSLFVHDLTLEGAGRTLFLLLMAWWAWMYTTWMTNWFDPDTYGVRLALLVGMLASMLGAIALPEAFGDRAGLLVAGYVGIQSLRTAILLVATDRSDPIYRTLQRIFAWNAGVGLIWVAGLLVEGDARVAVWLVALALDYAGPMVGHWTPGMGRSRLSEWELEPHHFVERIELFVIIALGESIVAAGLTASALEPTTARILAVVVGFGITVALWWLYFDFHAQRALDRLRRAHGRRGELGRDLSYVHIPLVAGIIVVAVGNEIVIAHPGEELAGAELLALAAGPVLYLLGSVGLKRRILGIRGALRATAAVTVAAAVAIGATLPALATWTLVLAVLGALAGTEAVQLRREGVPDALSEQV
jgi:low temperature requirement protein LtrA